MSERTVEPTVTTQAPAAGASGKDTPGATAEGLTRRQMLFGVTAGGAAIAASALGGGAVGSLVTRADYEVELTKLRALVALYEQLEKVGIDAVIATGMNVVRGSMEAAKGGVRLLRDGIAATQTALKVLGSMVDALRAEAERATQGLDELMQKFRAAETVVTGVLGTAQPLGDAIGGFFKALLDKIPFGIGDNIRQAVNALIALIRGIPTAIESVTAQLIKPLRDTFFPSNGTPPVQANVVDPITKNLLQPLDKFLGDVDTLITRWENEFAAPVQSALEQRQQIRQQITQYRQEHKI